MSTDSSVANAVVFGSRKSNCEYIERRAAYVVIIEGGAVAMVADGQHHFLPGGGSLPNETPTTTIAREVREELGLSVRLLRQLGDATQYFYSGSDDCHYEMLGVFFLGEFTNRAPTSFGEDLLEWVPLSMATAVCFHECHAWAVWQSVRVALQNGREPR